MKNLERKDIEKGIKKTQDGKKNRERERKVEQYKEKLNKKRKKSI